MVINATDYGALNVHMRAQRVDLITAGTYNVLAYATDFENLSQMMDNTKYRDVFGEGLDKKYPDLIDLDRRLVQHFVDQYNRFRKYVPKRSKKFIDAYSQIYFLNNLKLIITALHGANRYQDTRSMLISLTEKENEEIEQLYGSQNIEDLISKISNDDLKATIDEALGEYRFLDLVYPLTNAIDQYFYRKLCQAMSKLKGEDRNKVRSLFGTKIDIQNIEIILRSKTFDIKPEIVKKWLITTEFCTLRSTSLEKILEFNDLEDAFKFIRDHTSYRDLANRLLENINKERPPLENFDHYADQVIVHKANSIFRGASFNVAVFPAFFILKEMEIRNLRIIILGKIEKLSTNEILERVVLL